MKKLTRERVVPIISARERNIPVATSSDEKCLYVWRADPPIGKRTSSGLLACSFQGSKGSPVRPRRDQIPKLHGQRFGNPQSAFKAADVVESTPSPSPAQTGIGLYVYGSSGEPFCTVFRSQMSKARNASIEQFAPSNQAARSSLLKRPDPWQRIHVVAGRFPGETQQAGRLEKETVRQWREPSILERHTKTMPSCTLEKECY
jgi:hypothetical protein